MSIVTSQSERQLKLLRSTTNSFIIYFDDMSYLKLWNLLSSSALISANHERKLMMLVAIPVEWGVDGCFIEHAGGVGRDA